jgi:hypothetical protein
MHTLEIIWVAYCVIGLIVGPLSWWFSARHYGIEPQGIIAMVIIWPYCVYAWFGTLWDEHWADRVEKNNRKENKP